jgi:hypothetical protein
MGILTKYDIELIKNVSASTILDVRIAFEHGKKTLSIVSQQLECNWIYFVDEETIFEVKDIHDKISGDNSLMRVFYKILKISETK